MKKDIIPNIVNAGIFTSSNLRVNIRKITLNVW